LKKIFYILLFCLSFLFYWGTARYIENRSESDDAFVYATMVEVADHPWLYHPHHLIYGPSMQGSYSALQAVGYEGRAYGMLMFVSALSAAGSLFFFFMFCYRRYSLRPVSSLLATGLLGVSYGFWRYAAEAEIALPASLLVLAALYYATGTKPKRSAFLLAVAFSVLAVLMHIMNVVPVFFAIPCFYLLRRRWKAAVIHGVLSAGLVALVYGVIASMHPLYSGGGALRPEIKLGTLVKAMVALGQCVVSGDFVVGLRSARAFLSELFAARMLDEEFFMGVRLSRLFVLFSMLTYLLFGLLGAACVSRAVWVWKNMVKHRDRFQLPSGMATIVVAVIWFLGYAGLLICIEPGNPELWVMGLIPFWLIFCGLVLLPLTVDNRLWLPFAMLLILFIHNGAGGIGVLGDPAKDYQFQKAQWILEHASDKDVVITASDPVFELYLRYHCSGQVIYLHDWAPEQLQNGNLPTAEADVYVMGDVFNQINSLRIRFPAQTEEIDRYAEILRPLVAKVADDEFGGVFKVKTEESE
jgi:hypothetical protein